MIGSFLTRALILALGYAYPAYNCYKMVELNRPDIEKLRFWAKYWILIAVLTVIERFSDCIISWLPMYGEAKLAFIVYLWHPKTNGTPYVYDTFFRPFVAKHEREIDQNLVELQTRATDIAALYFSKALESSQALIFDVIKYISTQSLAARTSQVNDNAEEKQPAMASTSPVAQRTNSIPADRSYQDASSSNEPKKTEVESTVATRKGDGTEKTSQESAIVDAIRLTRAKLKKRIGSIGHGPNSGPNTPK